MLLPAWRMAEPLVVAALSAHAAIVVLTDFLSPVPLATAVVATLLFAAVSLAYVAPRGRPHDVLHDATASLWPRPIAIGLAFLCISAGARLLAFILASAPAFYCHAAVPWRIEIALCGSSASGFVTAIAKTRARAWLVYPLTMVAFLWIAPFYGFFSAPVFLAVSLNTECPDRSLAAMALVAFGMMVGARMGTILAERVSGP
jgi:hypothetical protein